MTLRSSVGTGERQGYASAMAGLWSGLAQTLSLLEALAAEPEQRLSEDEALELLPRLQYALHAASELALGIDPPAGAETAHAELAAALVDARDATAEVLGAVDAGGPATAGPLVHEWRGALFRVRLARLRLSIRSSSSAAPTPEPSAWDSPRAALAATALVLAGAAAFVGGAVLALWPVWGAGLVLVACGFLAYRP